MKNIKKLLAIVLTVLICLSFAGCNLIDEMRKNQIHYDKNNTINYDGKVYKLLPECPNFSPDADYDKALCITDKDVPVLLSNILFERAYLTKDEHFILPIQGKYTENQSYYARSDIYDDIAQRIESGDYYDGFCFYYDTFDEENYTYDSHYKLISEEAEIALKDIAENVAPEEDIDPSLLYPYSVMDLMACSDDFLFQEYVAAIYKTDKYIYIGFDFSKYTTIYIVPEEYVEIFEDLIKDYIKLTETYNDDLDYLK